MVSGDQRTVINRVRYALTGLLTVFLCACTNPCMDLSDKICDRTESVSDICDSVEEGEERCARVRSIAASCQELRETAENAGAEDQRACKANLELIRALERHQQQ